MALLLKKHESTRTNILEENFDGALEEADFFKIIRLFESNIVMYLKFVDPRNFIFGVVFRSWDMFNVFVLGTRIQLIQLLLTLTMLFSLKTLYQQ